MGRGCGERVLRCEAVVAILSPFSVGSANVLDELSFALEKGKRIVPVLYRDCEIPLRLHRIQYVDFRTDYHEGLQRLLATLGRQVSDGGKRPAPGGNGA